MVLNHLLDSQFKAFLEFLQSLIQFTLNPVILEQLERGKLIPILNDFSAGNRTLVLKLQGDGTGNRTIDHLAKLIEKSITEDQLAERRLVFKLPMVGPTPFDIFIRIGKAIQNIVVI